MARTLNPTQKQRQTSQTKKRIESQNKRMSATETYTNYEMYKKLATCSRARGESTCRRASDLEGVFTDLRLLHDLSVLTRTPHREKVEVSLKNTGHGVVFYVTRRVEFAGEARLDERNFPDGGGLEQVVRQPGLRVEEPDSRRIAGVLKRRQHLRGECTDTEGTASIRHVFIGVRPRTLSSTGSGKIYLCTPVRARSTTGHES